VEGYEGVAALVRGGPLKLPRYARGAPLKPALVVLEVGCVCITIRLYSISQECR